MLQIIKNIFNLFIFNNFAIAFIFFVFIISLFNRIEKGNISTLYNCYYSVNFTKIFRKKQSLIAKQFTFI